MDNKTIKQLRRLKRKRYIRKLFKHYYLKTPTNKTVLQIIDNDDKSQQSSSASHWGDGRHRIILDLPSLYNVRVKIGFNNGYYPDRNTRLYFVKNNKKLALRFIILHELAHCALRERGANSEYRADTYAIEVLKTEGAI